ncbi:50S ribosomal protein L4 [Nocardioides okcheonensis]
MPGAVDRTSQKAARIVKVDLPAEIFDVEVNIPLIHQVVVAQQAAARQGTHATKTRGEVRGGGRKPYKQKGTGRARQGSTRAPQFAGGGTVHGPQPRDYSQRTPKKMKAAALRGALSDRARNGRVHVVDSLVSGDKPSTKGALAALTSLTDRVGYLVVLERSDALTWLSLRNAPEVHIVAVDQLNTYDVLAADDVVFTKGAYDEFVGARRPVKNRQANEATRGEKTSGSHAPQNDASSAPSAGVATVPEDEELVGTGTGQTSDRSQRLDDAHEAARQQMETQSYRSTDPNIDGWSISSEDTEFVAIERHRDHVLVTWPSTLTAEAAVRLLRRIAPSPQAAYAEARDGYVAFDEPGVKVDWKRIAKLDELQFLRVDVGAEILVWKGPPDDDLQDNRFQVIEPSVESSRLLKLIHDTTDRDVVSLLQTYLNGKFDFEPLNAAG